MPWILWNSPVEVRPRARATSQAVACSEPRGSLVNFPEGVDPVSGGGRPVPRGPPPLPGHRGPSGRAGRACGASARGHHGRPGRVSGDAHRVRRRRGRNRARPCRESERRVVPLGDGGQQNLRRGKGPHFHPAADGETLRGDCREAGTPLSCSSGVPLWGLGRGAERAGCPCMPGAAGDRRAGCGQTARTVRRGDAGVLSLPGLVRHRQPKGAGTDRPALTPWHQCSTLPLSW